MQAVRPLAGGHDLGDVAAKGDGLDAPGMGPQDPDYRLGGTTLLDQPVQEPAATATGVSATLARLARVARASAPTTSRRAVVRVDIRAPFDRPLSAPRAPRTAPRAPWTAPRARALLLFLAPVALVSMPVVRGAGVRMGTAMPPLGRTRAGAARASHGRAAGHRSRGRARRDERHTLGRVAVATRWGARRRSGVPALGVWGRSSSAHAQRHTRHIAVRIRFLP